MFGIYYTNHSYYSDYTSDNLELAIAYGKSKGFDFRVDYNSTPIAAWSIIGGLRYF